MVTTINIDKAGRIVLPKSVRQELQIAPGDSLELERSDDHVVLRPARTKARMYKKHGIWVMNTGTPLAPEVVSDTIRKVREDRERSFLGK